MTALGPDTRAGEDTMAGSRRWKRSSPYRVPGRWVRLATLAAGLITHATAQQPSKTLIQQLADQGSRFEKERNHYSYRRSFQFHEMDPRGKRGGLYREVRDVLFTPDGERVEEFVGQPHSQLKRIRLTDEDFRDLREVQPFVLTKDTLWRYQVTYKGPETLDGEDCYVYRLAPRQVFDEDRLLDGLIWVSQEHEQIVRVAGPARASDLRVRERELVPAVHNPIRGGGRQVLVPDQDGSE